MIDYKSIGILLLHIDVFNCILGKTTSFPHHTFCFDFDGIRTTFTGFIQNLPILRFSAVAVYIWHISFITISTLSFTTSLISKTLVWKFLWIKYNHNYSEFLALFYVQTIWNDTLFFSFIFQVPIFFRFPFRILRLCATVINGEH